MLAEQSELISHIGERVLRTACRDARAWRSEGPSPTELRLEITAEGIETERQGDLLRAFGCRFGQGFLYAQPMPYAEMSEYLARLDFRKGPQRVVASA